MSYHVSMLAMVFRHLSVPDRCACCTAGIALRRLPAQGGYHASVQVSWSGPRRCPCDLKIRFTPVLSSALNDPFECRFLLNPAEKDRPAAQQDDFALESLQVNLFLKKFSRLGVLCLSKVSDNLLMWGHYCRSHSGFVIGFDGNHQFFRQQVKFRPLRSVERVLDIPGFGTLREVRYSPERFAINVGGAVENVFFVKSTDWSYEQEVRILRNIDDADTKDCRDEIHLFALPPDLIRQVIVGANADRELCSNITSIASGSML
jgi:hypothetical protein